jgi:Transposase DNA-binding/Transposase Tn5 dimerisation domain
MEQVRWAEREFGEAELGDVRRTRRLVTLATAMAERGSTSLPEVCEERAALQAGYRFFSNEGVRPEAILSSHVRATVERMRETRVVLAVQDTTALTYGEHAETSGLGPVARAGQRGMLVHTTLAVTPERVPLGLLEQTVWSRDAMPLGKRATRRARVLAEKESRKWRAGLAAVGRARAACPTTEIISVGDREADVYDLFVAERPAGVELLIRAAWDRRVADAPQPHLWDALAEAPVVATRAVTVPRRPGVAAREATVAVHVQAVTLLPPRHRTAEHLPTVPVTAVWVIETAPPPDTQPLEWMLLTTRPVTTAAQAVDLVDYYGCRWEIEVWHGVLKSGCRVEARQLATGRRLHRCLTIASVVAWRILYATRLARARPDLPCSVLLATEEWQALACRVLRIPTPPPTPPSLRTAVRWIAHLGGFIGRPADGEPGPTTLWRGLLLLAQITQLFLTLSPYCSTCA